MLYKLEYEDIGIKGWMSFAELNWLYQQAKRVNSVLEIGSWKGRSTHALLSGCNGMVTAVDTFKGSDDPMDLTCEQGKTQDIYAEFMKNVGEFENLEVLKMSSEEAKKQLGDRKFDMVFIDANHRYEDVKKDIELWRDSATFILCGHDLDAQSVAEAVWETVGPLDYIVHTIWVKKI